MQIAKVERETVSQKCDWLAFTVQFYKDIKWPTFIETTWKKIPPVARFTDGRENAQGVRHYWNTNRPQMGKHFILSGSCITTIGENVEDLLRYVLAEDFSVTRLDLCVDVRHSNVNIKNATYHLSKGQYKSHARSDFTVSSALQRGYTQQIGTKNSAAFVRIYDKAAEMGLDGKWVRFEIVYGKRKAKKAIETYLRTKNIGAMVRAFIDFPKWRKFIALMGAEKQKVEYHKKPTNTRVWLMDIVTKSLAREMALDTDQAFYLDFLQRVREEYYELNRKNIEIDF